MSFLKNINESHQKSRAQSKHIHLQIYTVLAILTRFSCKGEIIHCGRCSVGFHIVAILNFLDHQCVGISFGIQTNALQANHVLLPVGQACSTNPLLLTGNLARIHNFHVICVCDVSQILQEAISKGSSSLVGDAKPEKQKYL